MKEQNIKLFTKFRNDGYLNESGYNNMVSFHYSTTRKKRKTDCETAQDEKISVIVPTYNRKEQLAQCIDSILRQTYKNVEILIMDDSSNRDTLEIYNNYKDKRVKYFLNEKNLGIGRNRQKGYQNCTGDFVVFCDDDDYFVDDKYFEEAVSIFKNKKINIICANSIMHYEEEDIFEFNKNNVTGLINSSEYLENFHFNYSKPNSTFCAMFRKKTLDKADFKQMEMMNDTCIYLRALTVSGLCYFYQNIIGVYRIHNCNVTYNASAAFTIENFEEKLHVFKCINAQDIKFNKKKWFEKQISITARHFFNGKESRFSEIKKVLNWIRRNVSIKLYIKYLIVSLVRRKKNEN